MERLFLEGFFLQASLIFALGAQNLFVLEAGLKKEHHWTVSFVCFLCDLSLITLGVAGAGTLFAQFPYLKIGIGLLGIIFLFQYGWSKIFFKEEAQASFSSTKNSLRACILLSITFSILNPHAYLDAFILIGGFSSKYALLQDRLLLGLGAATFSLVWFLILSNAASLMKPIIQNPLRMKKVMCFAGVVLVALSGKLGIDVYSWMNETIINPFAIKNMIEYPVVAGNLFTSITY